ncbi:hypothetical protein L2E82_39180 [Cichorium intybus]|uniref:Uncharacterized protein n=1 Tax=Cichorium intybus TaxID=13427 RepID=A0ACB9AI98_CICIN|nr:hypothetical protein L2E82_39180 [Cichorium intybus]
MGMCKTEGFLEVELRRSNPKAWGDVLSHPPGFSNPGCYAERFSTTCDCNGRMDSFSLVNTRLICRDIPVLDGLSTLIDTGQAMGYGMKGCENDMNGVISRIGGMKVS